MRIRSIPILLLLLCIQSLLADPPNPTTTSIYVQQPTLQFQYGAPSAIAAYASSAGIQNTHFVAHLGTLTITTEGNNLKDPNLYAINMDTNISISGYVNYDGQYVLAETPVEVWAITQVGGVFKSVVQLQNGSTNLAPNAGNILNNQSSMISYIILINTTKGYGYFIPGMVYTITNSNGLGSFTVSVDPQGGGSSSVPVPIVVDGQVLPEAPIINVGGDVTPDIPFEGDDDDYPFTHEFLFSIVSNVDSFDLYDAIGGRKAAIATAQLQVSYGVPNKEYRVQIAFTSSAPGELFEMHLNGDPSQYPLPYYLYLDGEYMPKNVFALWDGIFAPTGNTMVQRPITVVVQEGTLLDGAPQGAYSDTVTVLIIPLDTL